MHARTNFSPALALKSWRRSFHFSAAWAPRALNLNVALAGPSPGPPTPPGRGASLFPAKREVKRELSKAWQAWLGNQTSSRCLVRSLVCLAGFVTPPVVQAATRWGVWEQPATPKWHWIPFAGDLKGFQDAFEDPQANLNSIYLCLAAVAAPLRMH